MRRRVILIGSTLLLIACCGCVGYLGEGNYGPENYDLGYGVRGYGERHYEGTRSSVFEHSGDRHFEGAASDRGFQSRSKAGHISSGRAPRGGGGEGFRGGKRK